jgi:hypothetical protein
MESPFVSPAQYLNLQPGLTPGPTATGAPGTPGTTGVAGSAGLAGGNCYCQLSAAFTIPALGTNYQATFNTLPGAGGTATGWMVSGQLINVGAHVFQVVTVDSTTLATIKPFIQAPATTIVAAGVTVSPSGYFRGSAIAINTIVTAAGATNTTALPFGLESVLVTKQTAAAGTTDFSLPAAASVPGAILLIKNINSYGAVRIGALDKLNGSPTAVISLTNNGPWTTFISDGAGWWA